MDSLSVSGKGSLAIPGHFACFDRSKAFKVPVLQGRQLRWPRSFEQNFLLRARHRLIAASAPS
jgi:hypothetical protein